MKWAPTPAGRLWLWLLWLVIQIRGDHSSEPPRSHDAVEKPH